MSVINQQQIEAAAQKAAILIAREMNFSNAQVLARFVADASNIIKNEYRKAGDEASPGRHSNAFHSHLDVCIWCDKHPFNLCEVGARIMNGEFKQL